MMTPQSRAGEGASGIRRHGGHRDRHQQLRHRPDRPRLRYPAPGRHHPGPRRTAPSPASPAGTPAFKAGKIERVEAWLESLGLCWESLRRAASTATPYNDLLLMNKVINPGGCGPDDTPPRSRHRPGLAGDLAQIVETWGVGGAGTLYSLTAHHYLTSRTSEPGQQSGSAIAASAAR